MVAEAVMVLANSTRAPAEARRFIGDRLGAWGLAEQRPSVVLAVSELVTNAVRHSRGDIAVRVGLADTRMSVEVSGEGNGSPGQWEISPTGHGPDDATGLRLVDMVADDWGSYASQDGQTVVWFEQSVA